MKNPYQTVSPSELDDFRKSCQRYKFNPDDFDIKEHDVVQTPIGNDLFNLNGKITISKNGKSKTYSSGNETKWPVEFDDDLKTGVFN